MKKLPENLQECFEVLELIHKTAKTEIWRVAEISTKKIFILRIMCRKNLVYKYLETIKHKNLPEIIFVEENEFATYVVEEFLDGKNLAEHLKKYGAFDEDKICQIGIEICNCLEQLHARHIIHRDIKPENLFLTRDGIFKLIDFDIARIEKFGRVADTEVLLTQGYAAPEQYGFQQTDERTDIYSLGMTLKMLAGYQNYQGFLTPIFQKCASFDPDKRYETAKDLKRAIIRSQKIHKWRKFLVAAFAISAIYFFVNEPAQSENIRVETPPVEKVLPEVSNIDEKADNLPVEKTSSDFPQIIYPSEENQNLGVYERYTPPSISDTDKTVTKTSDFDVNKIVAETSKKIDALNLEPPPKMPFRDFKNQMRNLNLSDAELEKKYNEHYRRLEFNQRLREFKNLLPQNLSDEEKNAATQKFTALNKN